MANTPFQTLAHAGALPVGATKTSASITAAANATGTLTSDNTNVADGATVVIGSTTYTFRTALTPLDGEVLIGASADASLLNLIRAINHSGTYGTDHSCVHAHPLVTAATSVTSHAFAVTARASGTAGNAIASTETSAHLSWGGTTLASGTDHAALAAGDVTINTVAMPAVAAGGDEARVDALVAAVNSMFSQTGVRAVKVTAATYALHASVDIVTEALAGAATLANTGLVLLGETTSASAGTLQASRQAFGKDVSGTDTDIVEPIAGFEVPVHHAKELGLMDYVAGADVYYDGAAAPTITHA